MDGRDLRSSALSARRQVLEDIMLPRGIVRSPCVLADCLDEQMAAFVSLGYEGIVVKHPGSTYQPGKRSPSWLKLKPTKTVDVYVIGATVSPAFQFGALVLAKDGRYYGKVGTGFSEDATKPNYRGLIFEQISAKQAPLDPAYGVPNEVRKEMILSTTPLPAEIKIQEEQNGSPRFPVWVRWRTEA
jgi:DNA ligase-1